MYEQKVNKEIQYEREGYLKLGFDAKYREESTKTKNPFKEKEKRKFGNFKNCVIPVFSG